MIRTVLKFAVVLIIGILVYNFFFGTEAEKAQSKAVAEKTLEIGKAGFNLLKDEYQKFREGKYDRALDKIGDVLDNAKVKGTEYADEIKDWEGRKATWDQKKKDLERLMDSSEEVDEEAQKTKIKELENEAKALEREGEELTKKVEEQ